MKSSGELCAVASLLTAGLVAAAPMKSTFISDSTQISSSGMLNEASPSLATYVPVDPVQSLPPILFTPGKDHILCPIFPAEPAPILPPILLSDNENQMLHPAFPAGPDSGFPDYNSPAMDILEPRMDLTKARKPLWIDIAALTLERKMRLGLNPINNLPVAPPRPLRALQPIVGRRQVNTKGRLLFLSQKNHLEPLDPSPSPETLPHQ
ncbi:hypothetical protein K432DRAFT_56818 [Lepidopterella palustris CBS 459.81]|uniref:Uncharacterized protein n=1 Tax=Lepidopterella palustris CBS 459.81 TaxID=1314670 RepID=A0A8E2EK30_9PEZI|nr:hypothetical protein K432DRAFT_56818 [Lepidopterella palustris CBS 459.81]